MESQILKSIFIIVSYKITSLWFTHRYLGDGNLSHLKVLNIGLKSVQLKADIVGGCFVFRSVRFIIIKLIIGGLKIRHLDILDGSLRLCLGVIIFSSGLN